VTVTDTFGLTTEVVIVKVAEVAPAGTVTVAGNEAAVPVIERFTTEPPVGAGDRSVTVPVTEFPPTTVLADRCRLSRIAGFIVIVAELV